MSDVFKPAEFGWPQGGFPGELVYAEEVPTSLADLILSHLDCMGGETLEGPAEVKSLHPVNGPAGRYRVRLGKKSFFVRISVRIGRPELEKGLTDHLLGERVRVNPILLSRRLQWKGGPLRLDVRPFLRGRHFNGSDKDIFKLAGALRDVHLGLKSFKGADSIQETAAERYDRLRELKKVLVRCCEVDGFGVFQKNTEWMTSKMAWFSAMAEGFEPVFHLLPGAQCLHGDVQPGNVIFSRETGEPVLIDFEQAIQCFAPPAWDLAYLVQRFCLFDDPDSKVLKRRLSVAEEGYGGVFPALASTMRQTAWFCMAVLLDLVLHWKVLSPLSEYEKFIELEQQTWVLDGCLSQRSAP